MKSKFLVDQTGLGVGEDAFNWIKGNPDKIAEVVWENRGKVFQTISNGQRFVSKNILRDSRPIRYLKDGEIHLPNHNFTGPGTRVDLPEVRHFKPYNNIDGCSKIHDLEFDEIFRMPPGPEREQLIRNADEKVIECYNQFPNESGYNLARMGINSKMGLEDLSPTVFDMIMGEDYRGAQHGIEIIEESKSRSRKRPGKRSGNKPKKQTGGFIDPVTGSLILASIPASVMLYGEYRGVKYIYDKLKDSK